MSKYYASLANENVSGIRIYILSCSPLAQIISSIKHLLLSNIAFGIEIYRFDYNEIDRFARQLEKDLVLGKLKKVVVVALSKNGFLKNVISRITHLFEILGISYSVEELR